MIDRRLNYGRHIIRRFLAQAPFANVLDIGAGKGDDLLSARAINPQAALHAVEAYPPNVALLRGLGVDVRGLDIEREALPFPDASLDTVVSNQTFEHIIFHNMLAI